MNAPRSETAALDSLAGALAGEPHTGTSTPTDYTQAALLLADAWEPALSRSYQLGYNNGYAAGFRAAEREMADAWSAAGRRVRDVLAQPSQAELDRRREVDHKPCARKCRRCSRCIHSLYYYGHLRSQTPGERSRQAAEGES